MNESAYFFILLFMGLMFVSPAFSQQSNYEQVYVGRQKEVKELFETIFRDLSKEEESLIPKDTKLLDFKLEKGNLLLNFSKEIKNYGGNLTEQWMVYRILSAGFSIPKVESITVFIEGKKDYFPEGTIIDAYQREDWMEERMKDEWRELTKENTR
jgi:spore germination protein GerM